MRPDKISFENSVDPDHKPATLLSIQQNTVSSLLKRNIENCINFILVPGQVKVT